MAIEHDPRNPSRDPRPQEPPQRPQEPTRRPPERREEGHETNKGVGRPPTPRR